MSVLWVWEVSSVTHHGKEVNNRNPSMDGDSSLIHNNPVGELYRHSAQWAVASHGQDSALKSLLSLTPLLYLIIVTYEPDNHNGFIYDIQGKVSRVLAALFGIVLCVVCAYTILCCSSSCCLKD